MRIGPYNGFGVFSVVDISTGATLDNVVWVDDTALEYAAAIVPYVVLDGEFAVDIHKVTAVRVDYVNKRIEVNTPAAQTQTAWPFPTASQPKACHECCQEATCRRLDYCAAHRGPFGQRAP